MDANVPPSPVTLDDVAARAGVSRWTVAAALRGRGRVNATTAQTLKALAAEMGYDASLTQAGRSLAEARHGRRVRHHLVALTIPAGVLDLPYYASIMRGLIQGLAAGGSAAVITDLYRVVAPGLTAADRFGTALLRGQVDAAIVHPFDQSIVEQLMDGWRQGRFGDRPVVTLIRPLPGLPCAQLDLVPALTAAIRALVALGHRTIGHAYWISDDRFAAEQGQRLAAILTDVGLDPLAMPPPLALPREWMIPRPDARQRGGSPETPDDPDADSRLNAWLAAHPTVTAVIAPNDAGALRLLAALRRCGRRVPEDISLIGCDATDDLADGGNTPFLATIRHDLIGLGEAAARTALALVEGPPTADPVIASTFLPGRSLGIARNLTGAP